jgi:mono/diheme cytochrome c family protein
MLSVIGRFLGCGVLLLAIAVPRLSSAQSAADVQTGKTLFGGLCVTCHGFEGAGGAGPPLNRPKLVNAPDDAALRAIISEGIPNRGMPRVRRTTESELRALVAYVRSIGRTAKPASRGNAKGTRLYANSMRVRHGQRPGRNSSPLTDIGAAQTHLRQAIVEPAAVPSSTLAFRGGLHEFCPYASC